MTCDCLGTRQGHFEYIVFAIYACVHGSCVRVIVCVCVCVGRNGKINLGFKLKSVGVAPPPAEYNILPIVDRLSAPV